MLQGVVEAIGEKFSLNVFFGTASAIPIGISALGHEPFNQAVEGQAVVESFVGELHKILHGFRGDPFIHFKDDVAVVLHFDRRLVFLASGFGSFHFYDFRRFLFFGFRRLGAAACKQDSTQDQTDPLFHNILLYLSF